MTEVAVSDSRTVEREQVQVPSRALNTSAWTVSGVELGASSGKLSLFAAKFISREPSLDSLKAGGDVTSGLSTELLKNFSLRKLEGAMGIRGTE